jgi:hypothetical protein
MIPPGSPSSKLTPRSTAALVKAADLQITQGPLPMSADAMRLRSLKRDLRRCYESQDDYPSLAAYGDAWCEIRREISPLEESIQQRPATSWKDCVELAEVAWWGIPASRH